MNSAFTGLCSGVYQVPSKSQILYFSYTKEQYKTILVWEIHKLPGKAWRARWGGVGEAPWQWHPERQREDGWQNERIHFSSFTTPASALALSCSKRSRRIEHQPCSGAIGRHTQPLPSHCAEIYAPSTHAVLFWSHLMKHSQKLGFQV